MKPIMIIILLFMTGQVQSQSVPIRGMVYDIDQRPQPATIVITPGDVSLSTNEKGEFLIASLRIGDTLIITAVGFEPSRFVYQGETEIIIRLQPQHRSLDEVVLQTGYETLPRERVTGSFFSIDKKTLNQQTGYEVLSRLEAISSGLQVDRITGSPPRIQVRGISTIQGPRDPLIIVDNFPYEGDINNINPNEVESITVLKDAAATSIWGARAGNGVIVITTTRPSLNRPLQLRFNNQVSITAAPDLYYMKEMRPTDYIAVEKFLFDQHYRLGDTASIQRLPLTPVYEILLKQKYGQVSDAEAARQMNLLAAHDLRRDAEKYLYGRGVAQQYHLSLSGGTIQLATQFSMGYDRVINELAAQNNRINLRLENRYQASAAWQFSTGIFLTRSDRRSGKPGIDQLSTITGKLPLYTMLADAEGHALPVMKEYRMGWADTVGRGTLLDWHYYPLTDHRHQVSKGDTYDLLLNADMQYKVRPWLSLTGRYQFERQEGNSRTVYDEKSYYTRNMVNLFSIPAHGNEPSRYIIPRGGILDISRSVLLVHNFRGQVNLQQKWQQHEFNMLAGAEMRDAKSEFSDAREYGYDPSLLLLTPVDYANAYPNYLTGSLSFVPYQNVLNDRKQRFVSTYFNAAYHYLSRYSITMSARKDGSNMLGVRTNDKWQPLWSAGIRWKLSDESFAPLRKWIDMQFRLTYGVSGNVDLSRTAVAIISYRPVSPFTQMPQAVISQNANPDLQWEKSYMLNAGLDVSLLNKRITGSIEYFRKRGTQLFGNAPVDYTGGAGSTVTKNVASMTGRGLDISIDAIVINKAFRWQLQLLYSTYRDKVKDYYLTSMDGRNFINLGRPRISGRVGDPVYSIYSFPWAGLDPVNGHPQGFIDGAMSTDYTKLTREPSVDDLVYHGPALPVHYGSMGHTFLYKRVDVTCRLLYKLGYHFRRPSLEYGNLYTLRAGHSDYAERWQKPGDELQTHVPSMVYPVPANRDLFYGGSAILVEKGDHVRISYISVGWNIPSIAALKHKVKDIRFYGAVQNVGILWRANRQGIDPDNPTASILPAKNFAVGLSASF